ncbi:hypothetical protein jhhlp_005545 [Lomentospora prolificans]|uniref:GRIP domain-containing protein n=1 Tax=Lomentospora prolificans TaxID=41688 RepID=A0A2N3N3F1_9PEZI|nr:hypothetical protein jhhlp_005545 [Lomentospora prolificans]
MSPSTPTEPTRSTATAFLGTNGLTLLLDGTGAKKKSGRKKKNANKPKDPVNTGNGEANAGDNDECSEVAETPVQDTFEQEPEPEPTIDEPVTSKPDPEVKPVSNGHIAATEPATESRSDASTMPVDMAEDAGSLREEVEQLRKQLEDLKKSHNEEVEQLKTEVEEANAAKENAEEQYETLLERVEKIKSTLSDRLKRDREELEESKDRVDELENQNEDLRNRSAAAEKEVAQLKEELYEAERELTSLRSRNNLSAQNWLKEKEELTKRLANLKEEIDVTTNAMGEWEVIAREERSVKEGLEEKVAELENQISSVQQAYSNAVADRDSQSEALDNLQKALQEIQEARKKELREMVEQVQSRDKSLQEADARVEKVEEEKAKLSQELERCMPFEKEVKEKNLLIGKLRHEAIVLNDHLTKALRYLKKTKSEDSVDRQIVTNQLLHFLTLDRSDPKRFQILQVMAGYLSWTDEQREQAGLARPGTSTGSLKLPLSPFTRTPSTASLHTDFMSENSTGKETLAELWAGFLERSAEEGAEERSRKDSASSAATAGTRP